MKLTYQIRRYYTAQGNCLVFLSANGKPTWGDPEEAKSYASYETAHADLASIPGAGAHVYAPELGDFQKAIRFQPEKLNLFIELVKGFGLLCNRPPDGKTANGDTVRLFDKGEYFKIVVGSYIADACSGDYHYIDRFGVGERQVLDTRTQLEEIQALYRPTHSV